jgi:hypothetical protein
LLKTSSQRPDCRNVGQKEQWADTASVQLVLVLWGSDRPCSLGHHPHAQIAHIGQVDVAEGRVIEPDLRERDEENLAYALV